MPSRLTKAMGWLFAIGSICFALGSLPLYFNSVGAAAAATTFFVGSLFFTSAGYIQYYLSINAGQQQRRLIAFERLTPDVLASGVQLLGTLFFNISTFDALSGQPFDTTREPLDLGARRLRFDRLPGIECNRIRLPPGR